MNVILFGMKAAGKTTVGRLLAAALQRPFDDVDQLIEICYTNQCAVKLPFREIYQAIGSAAFRALEREVILSWQSTDSVLSVGGSSLLDNDSYAHLKQQGQLVYLQLSFEYWCERVTKLEPPAYFLRVDDQGRALLDYYQQRDTIYCSRADLILSADQLSPPQLSAQLQRALS